LWHSHVGWLFNVKKNDWRRHTRDWLQDRRVMKINAPYFSLVLLGIVAPGVIGGLATQSVHGFVAGILWGGFAGIFALDRALSIACPRLAIAKTSSRRPINASANPPPKTAHSTAVADADSSESTCCDSATACPSWFSQGAPAA
jgi:hypothetical protein